MIKKTYPYLLLVLSLVGLIASSILMNDTIKLAENPQVDLPCNINPFLSCTSVASVWQSRVFGFPNPILGIISFSLLFGVALGLIYHVIPEENMLNRIFPSKKKRIFWTLVNLGSLASMIFVIWFAEQSIYVIGSLCIYCMIVWAVTWPIFLYTTIWNIQENHFSLRKRTDDFLLNHHTKILVVVYLLTLFLIFLKFRDFFLY